MFSTISTNSHSLGGYHPNECDRFSFEGNVIRVILNDDGTKTAQVFSRIGHTWREINTPNEARLIVACLGGRFHEFLIEKTELLKEAN